MGDKAVCHNLKDVFALLRLSSLGPIDQCDPQSATTGHQYAAY